MEERVSVVTVQGVINPVPAASVSVKAGSQSSKSYYCNSSSSVAHLAELEDNATGKSKERWNVENPFRRNSGIQRSPPSMPNATPPQVQTTPKVQPQEQLESENTHFIQLGNLITSLIEFMKGKSNVHHAIKEQARAIKAMYNKVRDEELCNRKPHVPETKELSTQTTPKTYTLDKKRSRESEGLSPKPREAKKMKQANKTQNKPQANTDMAEEKQMTKEEGNKWITTKAKRKPRKRQERKDVIIISSKGEASYADILKHIKSDPSLKGLGESVSRIRRTQKGDLLLEMENNNKANIKQFQEQVEKSIGQQANIKTRTPEIMIECKDVDEITTKSDICEALNNQLGGSDIKELDIKSLRKGYGGTQIATFCLPLQLGRKALEIGKIRIGWVICRLREKVVLKKCFRCLEFGHTSMGCTNPHDRSKLCRRCGLSGHIAKDCDRNPECMFCKEVENANTNHIAGSARCPVFKRALSGLRN